MTGPGRTTDEINMDKRFAPVYRETTEEISPDEIGARTLKHDAIDFTYQTRQGTKTVRGKGGVPAGDHNDIPDGFVSFFDDGKRYAYNPDEQKLISVNRNGQNRTLAEADDFHTFEEVEYPERAPVNGAVQTDVEATIYYRSPHSDEMQDVTVEVSHMEGNAVEITGTDTEKDRRIVARTRFERDIISQSTERTLGKVARVEFPKGHRFTVEVENLPDEKAGKRGEERIAKQLQGAFNDQNVSVEVTHEGRIEFD